MRTTLIFPMKVSSSLRHMMKSSATQRRHQLSSWTLRRKEYEQLHVEIDKSKKSFLAALKEQSKSKRNLEVEVSSTFTKSESEFYRALIRIKDELLEQEDAPYAGIDYDTLFDEKVLSFLGTKDFKTAIEEYTKKYNELLAASKYFTQGTFNYNNAATILEVVHQGKN